MSWIREKINHPSDAVYEAAHAAVKAHTEEVPTWLITVAVNAALAQIEKEMVATEVCGNCGCPITDERVHVIEQPGMCLLVAL